MAAHVRLLSLTSALWLVVFVCVAFPGTALAAPSITLSKKVGPPTSKILVSGSGFAPNVGVDIFFDTKDEALVVTDGKGNFHDAKIHAPSSAFPGKHWVTALERNNDKGDQEPFVVNTNWAQYSFSPDHEGSNPYENVLNSKNVGNLTLRWKFATGEVVSAAPTIANGILYAVSYDSYLYAVNAFTGALLWTHTPGGIEDQVAVSDGAVYGGLYALNARTGSPLWSDPCCAPSPPVVADETVYTAWGENDVAAFDARTGAQMWSFTTLSFPGAPTVANGVVYVGSDSGDNNIYALDAKTGTKLWNYTTGNGVVDAPAVANGIIYAGSFDNYIYALNANTGALLWKQETWPESSPAVAHGRVYVSGRNALYALDAATGAQIWVSSLFGSQPTLANGVVFFCGGNIYALDARTGAQLWTYATGANTFTPVTVANGFVYVGSEDFNVYAFSLPGAEMEAASDARPDLKTLHPDLMLQPSSRP